MSNMFYNYDNNIECDCHTCNIQLDKPKTLEGWSSGEVIYNYKYDEIGLGFNAKSPITLMFKIDGYIINDKGEEVDVDEFISENNIKFEFLNFRQQLLFDSTFSGKNAISNGLITLTLGKDAVTDLIPGIYYLRLTLCTTSGDYILFSPEDSIIHIS